MQSLYVNKEVSTLHFYMQQSSYVTKLLIYFVTYKPQNYKLCYRTVVTLHAPSERVREFSALEPDFMDDNARLPH